MRRYEKIEFGSKWKLRAKLGCLVGLLALIYLFFTNAAAAWVSVLANSYYVLGVAVFSLFFLALGRVTSAAWWVPFRRIPEAFGGALPLGALLLLVSLGGMHHLYEWSHHEVVLNDPILVKKIAWLNPTAFVARMLVILGIWAFFSRKFESIRREEATLGAQQKMSRWVRWSALFIVSFVVTWNVASFDWLMSIEPHWFSTIYAVYCFMGGLVSCVAVITVALVVLKDWGYFPEITENHFHDLGKFLFAFSTFWMYIWLCQYILIWYANIPEETMYYVVRGREGWDWLVYFANPALNWLVPFCWLLPRAAKRNPDTLFKVCVVFLVGRWFDIYLLIAPQVFAHAGIKDPSISFSDVWVAIGFASAFGYVVIKKLEGSSERVESDPFYEEGIALEQ